MCCSGWSSKSHKQLQGVRREKKTSPVGSIQPSHTEGLKHHHDDEGQSGRIVIKHGHKVVPTALREDEANDKADDTAENCQIEGKKWHREKWKVSTNNTEGLL